MPDKENNMVEIKMPVSLFHEMKNRMIDNAVLKERQRCEARFGSVDDLKNQIIALERELRLKENELTLVKVKLKGVWGNAYDDE